MTRPCWTWLLLAILMASRILLKPLKLPGKGDLENGYGTLKWMHGHEGEGLQNHKDLTLTEPSVLCFEPKGIYINIYIYININICLCVKQFPNRGNHVEATAVIRCFCLIFNVIFIFYIVLLPSASVHGTAPI